MDRDKLVVSTVDRVGQREKPKWCDGEVGMPFPLCFSVDAGVPNFVTTLFVETHIKKLYKTHY